MAKKGLSKIGIGIFLLTAAFAVFFNLFYSAGFSSFEPFFTQYLYHILVIPLLLTSAGYLAAGLFLSWADKEVDGKIKKWSKRIALTGIALYFISLLMSFVSSSASSVGFVQFFLQAQYLFFISGALLALGFRK